MKYRFVSNYNDIKVLRDSLNELTQATFSFDFESWYEKGFWKEQYIPYSLVDNGKIVANVSVNIMDFDLDGVKKHYIQIGTVMTAENYRNKGLGSFLMERVITEYRDKIDGIYLFCNDKSKSFYLKYGFKEGNEYQFSKKITDIKRNLSVLHININDLGNRQRFLSTVEKSAINSRLSMKNYGLITFWTMGPMNDNIYYHPSIDTYVIAHGESDILYINDIISTHQIDLNCLISGFDKKYKKVILGFTPLYNNGYEVNRYHEDDYSFLYLGSDLENIEKKQLFYPTLSHA